jgi:membrane-bound lytic murein transglycosylase B
VLEALSTLGFHYPKRAAFFKKELEEFLLLVKEQQFDPLSIKGSYAGAMGKPQFMPSSYRHFAVDFHGKGQKNVLSDNSDAIGSIANYFKLNGWQAKQPVLISAVSYSEKHILAPKDKRNPKPTHTILDWIKNYDVSPTEELPNLKIDKFSQLKAALIELDGLEGKEHWLGLHNFYVITRYNHSDHYAMAVYQLGKEIKNRLAQTG